MASFFDWAAALGPTFLNLGGQVAGGLLNRGASEGAAEAYERAAGRSKGSIRFMKRMYRDYQREQEKYETQMRPWYRAGREGIRGLRKRVERGPGKFKKSPGYQFRLGEGIKAVERGAAARGGLLSGRTAKAITRFGQNVATEDYDNFLRRYYQSLTPWQSMAGMEQTMPPSTAGLGVAGDIANIRGQSAGYGAQAGLARASGYGSLGAGIAGGLVGAGQNLLDYYMINKLT